MTTHSPDTTTILCPTRFETRALRRTLGSRARISCTGPGALMTERALDGCDGPVILAGVAGALTTRHPPGSAWWIREVRGSDGACWQPPDIRGEASVVVTSVEDIIDGDDSRAALARTSGADLVDQESVTLARICTARGQPWAIVRGVSDGPGASLPSMVGDWLRADGSLRIGRVALDVVRSGRADRVALRALSRHSGDAMRSVARLILGGANGSR